MSCKKSSVVDYVIPSMPFLKHFTQFSVKDFCELYSDAHASLEFGLNMQLKSDTQNPTFTNEGKIRQWDETKCADLVRCIDQCKIDELNGGLKVHRSLIKIS